VGGGAAVGGRMEGVRQVPCRVTHINRCHAMQP